jgi:hypothetical protein
MFKLKDPRKLMLSAFHICEEEKCKEESTKIWTNHETRILDLCDKHYNELELENI